MVRAAVADGRLELDEVDARLETVYHAKTHGELDQVIGDLLIYRPPPPMPPPVPATWPAPPAYFGPHPPSGVSDRKILPAFLLCLFVGVFGAHRFYSGNTGSAIAMLLITVCTLGIGVIVTGVWALVDLIVLAVGSFRDGGGNTLRDWT